MSGQHVSNCKVRPTRSDCGCTGRLPGVNVCNRAWSRAFRRKRESAYWGGKISCSPEFNLHLVNLDYNEEKLQWQKFSTNGSNLKAKEQRRAVKKKDTLHLAKCLVPSFCVRLFVCLFEGTIMHFLWFPTGSKNKNNLAYLGKCEFDWIERG